MKLGMSDDDYTYLTTDTDFIIHAAANVNLAYPYSVSLILIASSSYAEFVTKMNMTSAISCEKLARIFFVFVTNLNTITSRLSTYFKNKFLFIVR